MSDKDDLNDIFIRSAITNEGDPFCIVSATSKAGHIFLGQLEVEQVREMALMWLAAAAAAEQDAAALRVSRRLELPDEFAHELIGELRDGRAV